MLLVDNQEVPIEYFTEVLGGTAVERGDAASIGTLPALAPGAPVSTSYLVFIDEFFTVIPERNRVIKKMIEQLPVMSPEDRMAIVAFDGRQLEMLSTWSQSIPELTRALEGALERPAFGLRRLAEFRNFETTRRLYNDRVNQLSALGRRTTLGDLDIEEEQEAERVARQVRRITLAAASAMRGFANPPGRKVMLLMAGGWPYNPAVWVTGDLALGGFSTTVPYGDELYEPLVNTANRLSYTIYPVDVENRISEISDVELGVNDAQLNRDIYFDRRQEERTSLNFLAEDTGGSSILGPARYSALERAASDTRTYYWIGFTPQWKGDDASHRVRLKAREKGLKVRSREGFSDLSRQTEVSMMVESSLLFGGSPTSGTLYAETGEGKKSGRGKVQIPLSVIVPVSELTFLPYEGQYVAEVELRVAVQDEDGNMSEVPVMPIAIALEAPPQEGELRRYDTELRMRRKKHDLVVSLYDNASGKILATRLEVDPRPETKEKKE